MQRNVVRLHNLLSNNAEARAHSAFVDAKFAELFPMLASRKGVRDEELAKAKVCTVPVNTGACDSIFVVMVTFNYTARFSRLPVSDCRTSSRRYSTSVTPVHYPLTLLLRKLASRHLLNSRLAVALSTGAV